MDARDKLVKRDESRGAVPPMAGDAVPGAMAGGAMPGDMGGAMLGDMGVSRVPGAMDGGAGMLGALSGGAGMLGTDAPIAPPVVTRVGVEQIRDASVTLAKYRMGKASLDKRIVDNQQWYRLRHWETMRRSKNPGDPEPASAWLLNSIANKHADAMDNYPEPVILPREAGDDADAKMLSSILPVVLEQNHFDGAYSDMWWRKLKSGTGAYGVFWDTTKLNGLGDIDIRSIDLLNLFWEPGIKDIQVSRNLFNVELMDNDLIEARYPQTAGKLGATGDEVKAYVHDEQIDTTNKSAVIDWYYRVYDGTREVLHYAKYVCETLLFASENDPAYAERGIYDHGKYPFVFDTLYPDEDSPAGFGYLDICKDPQMRIDKLNQVIVKNAVMSARPRYFVRGDGAINEGEFADWQKDFVHFSGGGTPSDSLMQIQVNDVSANVMAVLSNTVDELKETSGNRDFSQGGTAAGVTAASAIAALQEAGSKLSRDMIKSSYRSFSMVSTLAIELIRQFYTEPRMFRITGERGAQEFVQFDSGGMAAQPQGTDYGIDMGMRVPVYDIVVKAQKASPFSVAAQNEMAKEFYAAGFFNPQMADQALACMEMMTFEGKESLTRRIAQNGTMYQQLQALQMQSMQLAAVVDAQNGTSIAQGMGEAIAGGQAGDKGGQMAAGAETQVNALGVARKNSDRSRESQAKARAGAQATGK